jgi:hypothetical protein
MKLSNFYLFPPKMQSICWRSIGSCLEIIYIITAPVMYCSWSCPLFIETILLHYFTPESTKMIKHKMSIWKIWKMTPTLQMA